MAGIVVEFVRTLLLMRNLVLAMHEDLLSVRNIVRLVILPGALKWCSGALVITVCTALLCLGLALRTGLYTGARTVVGRTSP